MKFAHFSHVWNKPGMTPAERYDQLWRELRLCDELGFDFAFSVEHHFNPHESWMTSPSIYCTGAAAHTRRLRVGPMGYTVPLYDPIRIVEEAAMLDHILHGRLELGLVSGIVPDFFQHYGADFHNRRALAHEGLDLAKTAFTSPGGFSFHGPYHQYRDIHLSVRPMQRPHPPLWMQSRDRDTLEVLAREGVHTGYLLFMPREDVVPRYRDYLRLWQQARHEVKPNIAYWTLVHVDETDQRAKDGFASHLTHCFTKVFGTRGTDTIPTMRLAESYEKRGELGAAEIARNLTNMDYLLERNLIFVGAPDTVAERLATAARDGLFNTILCEFNVGAVPEEDLMRSITLFGSEVIPALKGFEPYGLNPSGDSLRGEAAPAFPR